MIELSSIGKRYGSTWAVRGLSLTIPAGRVFGFLGQNGAGKTTTIKMIAGLSKPDEGDARIGGVAVLDPESRRQVGFMPEAPYFYDRLTGLEFMRFCGELFALSFDDGTYAERLRSVGLFDARNRAIATYSKGMKQRLGFAQALVNDPAYLLLDEPLDGLDPIGRKEIKTAILRLKADGTTIFFNSHILYDTEALCDEVGIIHDGTLIYAGAVSEFCAGHSLEERFVETVEAHKTKPRS